MGVLEWEELLGSGDRRWARLVVGPEAEVEGKARELWENPPPGGAYGMVVWGGRCRDSAALFREFDRAWEPFWGMPDHSGQNWDGFAEGLAELAERGREGDDPSWGAEQPDAVLVLVLRSPKLLRDEPGRLRTLTEIMRTASLGLYWPDKDRPQIAELRIVFQFEPEEAEALKERLARAGLDWWGEPPVGQVEGEPS